MAAVSEVVWRPDRATVEHANATRLVRRAGVADFGELVRRSQEDPAWFWPLVVEDLGLEFSRPWTQVLDDSRGPAWTTWFVGATLNIAHNCVHRWAASRPDGIFLPMSPEVAVASHAIAHIGAIQVPIFSGLAAPAVAQRLQASEAKVVITQ